MLKKQEIEKWYDKYEKEAGKHDLEVERDLLMEVKKVKTHSEFKNLTLRRDGILWWKGTMPRNKRHLKRMNSSTWKELFAIAKKSKRDPKKAVEDMVFHPKIRGISYPSASTIVYFFSGGECPIIDWRAVLVLHKKGYSSKLEKVQYRYYKSRDQHMIIIRKGGWDDYYELCRQLVSDLKIKSKGSDTRLRVLDKALWAHAGNLARKSK